MGVAASQLGAQAQIGPLAGGRQQRWRSKVGKRLPAQAHGSAHPGAL